MNGRRILLVEDDFITSMETREFLEEEGFTVDAAYCGEAALEMLRRHGDLAFLISDVDLGPGPNGFAVARCARAIRPGIPVIFISGSSPAEHAAEGIRESQFIAKPFRPEQIRAALRTPPCREAA